MTDVLPISPGPPQLPSLSKKDAQVKPPETVPANLHYPTPPSTAPTKQSHNSSTSSWMSVGTEVEERLAEILGRSAQNMGPSDVWRCKKIQAEMELLPLSQNFNLRGTPRFHYLGLTYAVHKRLDKQDENIDGTDEMKPVKSLFRARASRLALEAVQGDRVLQRKRVLKDLTSHTSEVIKAADVNKRQIDAMFAGISEFKDFLPEDANEEDLMPLDCSKNDEHKARRMIEILNGWFHDPHWLEGSRMHWLLSRVEIEFLCEIIGCWQRASRGQNLLIGMDRSTFCRFILDIGLAQHITAPFFWAVSLFDMNAVLVRVCANDTAAWAPSAPFVYCVSMWKLMSVLDTLLRQHYKPDTKRTFISKLMDLDVSSLPTHLAEDVKKVQSGPKVQAVQAAWVEADRASPPSARLSSPPSFERVTSYPGTKEYTMYQKSTVVEEAVVDCLCRDRLLASMLVEPDVLHFAMQHFSIFQGLHGAYADAEGHLGFPAMQQFLIDYHFVPDLCSANLAQRFYDEATSVEVIKLEELPPDIRQNNIDFGYAEHVDGCKSEVLPRIPRNTDRKSTSGSVDRSMKQSMIKRASTNSRLDPLDLENDNDERQCSKGSVSPKSPGPSPGASPRTPRKKESWRKRASISAFDLDVGVDILGRASTPLENDEPLAVRKEATMPAIKFEDGQESENEEEEQQVLEEAIAPPKRTRIKPKVKFGASAFMEVVFKLGFLYLGSYGNLPQQSSTAHMRCIWLICYLRKMAKYYKAKFPEFAEDGFGDDERISGTSSLSKTVALSMAVGVLAPDSRIHRTLLDPRTPPPVANQMRKKSTINAKKGGKVKKMASAVMEYLSPGKTKGLAMKREISKVMSKDIKLRPELDEQIGSDSSDADLHDEDTEVSLKDLRAMPPPRGFGSKSNVGMLATASPGARASLLQANTSVEAQAKAVGKRSSNLKEAIEVETPRTRRKRSDGIFLPQPTASPAKSPSPTMTAAEKEAEYELSRYCIQALSCKLCLRPAPEDSWGDARCRGCSIIDAARPDTHPWKALLSLPPDWTQTVAEAAVVRSKPNIPAHELQMSRPCVTPPPISAETRRILNLFELQASKEVRFRKKATPDVSPTASPGPGSLVSSANADVRRKRT